MKVQVQEIINRLNQEVVTLASYDFNTKRITTVTETLKERLATSAEESILVGGAYLLDNGIGFDVDDELVELNNVYCLNNEDEAYNLGDTYLRAKNELEEGYVSQLSNTQLGEDEEYWETIFTSEKLTKFDEETLIFS
ncbi:hypothetical protein [Ligilactobacillus equi]|uniref:Uncharacterized protein n=1 Tax=Ligilactobacillus equi DSM 15833 = JCM 10991 TaxID=1423740 RepID=A0A0R1TR36_9LACO|nr:hypothetical protein [Ligilactobacillus equi]KRL79739.1 hypothetical protein FC36_GL000368 [Ligilactobacillus equi DSM 15833 = JCM 10991]